MAPSHKPVGKPGAAVFPHLGLHVPQGQNEKTDEELCFANGFFFFSRFLKQNIKCLMPDIQNRLQGDLFIFYFF